MKTARCLQLLLASFALVSFGAACGGSGSDGKPDVGGPGELIDNGFESDDPSGKSQVANRGGEASDAGAAASAAPNEDGASKDAQRAIEEADIIKLDGTRLYALSRYGGLSIIDVTNPDALQLVGRKRTEGIPFEMYVRNGKVHVMLNDMERYVRSSADAMVGQWVQTSQISVLDVQNPSSITEVANYDVPGSIADSRLVGDVLYLVTYENGYCWGCQKSPGTFVTSFNVAGQAVSKVDSMAFTSASGSYSWKRSVAASNQRLYIAGPEWNWQPGSNQQASSVIQVVDISNPAGVLQKGADVPVAGQINSRWQMDEHDGVLRVVSQFGNGWGGGTGTINPKVQTFTIASSASITPLGSTELILPKPEMLQSVRFDGPRGYAITSERMDPLFTIDLSNPAAPKQAGELEMPGWIFHMEPRGDRLIGFGYSDTTSRELAVSLFDVSNLSAPTMIKRVAFGSSWSSVAEDQDRIHKSVRVLDEHGLILVPFASYGGWDGSKCEGSQSGIQLIDYSRDALALRGVAPQYGMPRRAMVTNGRLLAMSDRSVTSFDISSRDNPVKKHELDLSNPSYRTTETANHVASLTNDWWSGAVTLSLTPKTDPDDARVVGKVSLASLAPANEGYCRGPSSWTAWYQARIFGEGSFVYVTVPVYDYSYSYGTTTRGGRVIFAAIDASNPAAPAIVSKTEVELTKRTNSYGYYGHYGFWDGYGYYSYYGGAVIGAGEGVVKHGSKLAYLEVDYEYVPRPSTTPTPGCIGCGGTQYDVKVHRKLHVVDFGDATAPSVNAPIDLGESLGMAPLHLAGGVVHTSRWVPSKKTPGKVRFFVDRVDLNGAQPVHRSSLNTPGSLLSIDEPSSRWVTSDYRVQRAQATDWQSCRTALGRRSQFNYDDKECYLVTRSFKLSDVAGAAVSLRQTFDPPSQNIGGVVTADDRIYVTRYADYEYPSCNSGPCTPTILERGGLWAIGGIRAGNMSIVSSLDGDARWPLGAHGSKVALYTDSGLAIYDTTSANATLVKDVTLRGYGYTSHVNMSANRAVCSLGEWGIQTVSY